MKLLTKTTVYFLIVLVPLLTIAGFYLFNQFSREINFRSDKELISVEIRWIQYLGSAAENGTVFVLKTPDLSIFPTDAVATPYPALTNSYGYISKEKITYRQLSQVVAIGDNFYQINIRQSQEQKAALVADVTRIMLFVFIGLFAATLIFNWAISKRLWKPFKRSLGKIRSVELQKMEAIHFEETGTREFDELNASLNYMTNKIYKDYVNMKEFTENAAHEMQTPVAVVQSKLELLLQDSNLRDEQVQSILQSSEALRRLSKLNEGLLLLAKIENHQYDTAEALSLITIVNKYLHLFEDFIKEKMLFIETDYEHDFLIKLHPLLADSLISNLLGNAIKYNVNGGKITINIFEKGFQISNTSPSMAIESDRLFKRLTGSKELHDNSNGLGLAIVKRILDTHHLQINYQWKDGVHTFKVTEE
ncbi:MAG: HAMP domain-containing histidine kinase [Bacteroidota bacterium]|nr:HAMP domain-containing histidine kinase [Bacteroidota bacterium]